MGSELTEEELHLRYLEWCSARVARRFLELSHDEVWLRSQFAESLGTEAAPTDASPDHPLTAEPLPGFLDLVRRTAVLLAAEMKLPSFQDWKIEYTSDPTAFDNEIPAGD